MWKHADGGRQKNSRNPTRIPDVATAGRQHRIYVTNENSGDVSVIDPYTASVIATIPVGERPRGIHASPATKPSTLR
jgi:YVTN family beta-propeller protein